MKRKQRTPNTTGRHDPESHSIARVYPHDGIAVPGKPGAFRMRSGTGLYVVDHTGAIVRIGNVG